ncbi:hypothetical protein KFE25_006443 [Diacronema lutheri]|uniref:Protein NO VEIN C-terminal domain-containing protein n=1 Tax=Diacronema lutheri TaxID=2081491 RepID=A0A8J6CJI9_DIALT|nr:hypothetical protein KFE25_006443 [Diacronema lutheri]
MAAARWPDVDRHALAIARRIAADGAYVTHAAVVHELAHQYVPYGVPVASLCTVPSLALLARLQETVDGFIAAFVDSRAIATVRDLEAELPVVLRSFGLSPLHPPAPSTAPDPEEIDLDAELAPHVGPHATRGLDGANDARDAPARAVAVADEGLERAEARGVSTPLPTFGEYGLGSLLAHPAVRLHWRVAHVPPALALSLSAADVLRVMRDGALSGKLPADMSSDTLGAHLCELHGARDTRELGVRLGDVTPLLLLARHAWRREQEQLARAFNTGHRACAGHCMPTAARPARRRRARLRPALQPTVDRFVRECSRALGDGVRAPTLAQVRGAVGLALDAAAPPAVAACGGERGTGADAGCEGEEGALASANARRDAPGDAGNGALRGAQLELATSVLVEYAMLHLGGRAHRAKRFQLDDDDDGGDDAGAKRELVDDARECGGSRADGIPDGELACAPACARVEHGKSRSGAGDEPGADADGWAKTTHCVHDGPEARKRPRAAEDGRATPEAPNARRASGPNEGELGISGDDGARARLGLADGFCMVVEKQYGGGPRRIANERLRACLPFCTSERGATDAGATRNDARMREAGRWGEQLVYQLLLLTHAGAGVRWLNEASESGLGYDLELMLGGRRIFVEVKSTRHARKNVFQISSREWELARKMGDGYHLYRVYAAMDPALVAVDHVVDPVRMLESGQIALCLAV